MAKAKRAQWTVYPDPTIMAILGGSSPAANRALACWAIELRKSMPALDRAEWNFLADVLNGTFDGDYALQMYEHGASALALEVHDAQALNGTGDKWFGEELRRGSGQAAAEALEARVLAMSWEEIQYIRTATNFFWGDCEGIDHGEDEWWTIEFRVRHLAGG